MRMMKLWGVGLIFAVGSVAGAQEGKVPNPFELRKIMLNVGQAAPDFELQDIEGKTTMKLSKLKGKPVVLIFGSCT